MSVIIEMTTKIIVLACLLAVSQASLSGRIVGGTEAQANEFPHQVSLQYGRPPRFPITHFCGATIINERFILTAGHCIQSLLGLHIRGKVIIKAGKHALNVTESTEQISEVETFVPHKNYTSKVKTAPYDITLIQLETPFHFNEHVSAISLPAKGSEPTGAVIMSGWGSVADDKKKPTASNVLQKASLEIIDRATCRKAVVASAKEEGREISEDVVDETNICTGPLTGEAAPCAGDDGGPLISKDENGKTTLVGVSSWLNPCGRKGYPAVYVKVASIVDWIQDVISKK